ncbi:antibiotic biosynthesis monooxygenase family protein [Chitinophaga japonensis]|uniref:Heme-degrading monooxygenase HmoA n=1 Tax=Chitinophaga japonensis TaxID=104662 RepID=A0A562SSX5_CHIJA|nr:antibiotic biosynthesis monooxygenase family protein [Chitinophaga japonensis]TWI84208.1 heme-degrading monooxygenase HmoA [Chitinophaga japonensis]
MKTIYYLILLPALCFASIGQAQHNNKTMKTDQYSVEIIRYNIPEDQQASFEKAYSDAGKYLQASPYCLGYHIIHGEEEPTHYIVTIHWTSKEDHLNGFRKSSEFTGFFQLVQPFFSNIEEMKHYNLTPITWNKEK